MADIYHSLVKSQFDELIGEYPGFFLDHNDKDSTWFIKGSLDFCATYESIKIEESFQIEIIVYQNYPESLPVARETGGRIPSAFHKYKDDSLCLGAPVDIKVKFYENPTLLGFVNNHLIPFLFSYSYWEKYGVMPYGELSHGGKGLIEYYSNYFSVNSESIILSFLAILASNKYRGHHDCPCGSGKIIRKCHGEALSILNNVQKGDDFLWEFMQIIEHMTKIKINLSVNLPDKKYLDLIRKRLSLILKEKKYKSKDLPNSANQGNRDCH